MLRSNLPSGAILLMPRRLVRSHSEKEQASKRSWRETQETLKYGSSDQETGPPTERPRSMTTL
jgi:hypothetical protein